MPNPTLALPVRRRTLFALAGAGGAGAVLSACGAEREEPSAELDVEVLVSALEEQRTVASAYRNAEAFDLLDAKEGEWVAAFADRAIAQVEGLVRAIQDAGGTPSTGEAAPRQAENVLEPIAGALNDAIAALRRAVGRVSTADLRLLLVEFAATDAAQLAVVQGALGEDQAPHAFVTGGDDPPLEADVRDEGADGETSDEAGGKGAS